MELDESQSAAVELALRHPLTCITGGPGTGKTTTLRALLDRLDAERRERTRAAPTDLARAFSPDDYTPAYVLGSPTGKAARRLSEATGRPASTLHRLLGYHPVQGWRVNRDEPIDARLVVVDEASMLDTELAAALLDAIDPGHTRLLLVGDANQLPSVGPGRVFGDLIESGRIPVARLTTLHRAAQESWICRNAPVVLRGQVPEMERPAGGDFLWVEENAAARIPGVVVELVTKMLPGLPGGGVKPADVQVLAPQRNGAAGVDVLNAQLQQALNPPSRATGPVWELGFGHRATVGDRVIQTKNDYGLGVMNGETGFVSGFTRAETPDGKGREVLCVTFDGRERPVEYGRFEASELRLAYCLTVHRSQGSEWRWVVVVCHSTHTFMLSRQILYTAITRAKRGVVIVGDVQGVKSAVRNDKPARRNTTLVERLRAGLPAMAATGDAACGTKGDT